MVGKAKWGVKVRTDFEPWISFGIHFDFLHLHFDIHFLWWIFVVGNTVEPVYCVTCGVELPDEDTRCVTCDRERCPICGELESKHIVLYECPDI